VQKLIAKYATAAHLALLAVAPLFLFAFLDDEQVAISLLWLSLPAAAWSILQPSVRSGESLSVARRRVFRGFCTDPLFWAFLLLVLVTGVRALNGGITLVYDVETAKWNLSPSRFPFLPCCMTGSGFLPFAALVAGAVLVQGCRHSLGRSARMSFLLMTSSLAGLAAILALFVGHPGDRIVQEFPICSITECFPVGAAFYLHLLGGTVALVAAFEKKWRSVLPFFILAIGGTAAAGFVFSPALVSLVFIVAEILILVYVLVYSLHTFLMSEEFKLLIVLVISLAMGVFLAIAFEPSVAAEHLAAFMNWDFLPDSFVAVRDILSGVAVRSWLSNLWIGTGLGSFPLVFRFMATSTDWQSVRMSAQAVPNGWLLLLTERGIVGVLIVGLPVGFLLYTYTRRLFGWAPSRTYCHPMCCLAPLVLIALAVAGIYSCLILRADVIIMTLAILAVSANSFLCTKRADNG